MYMLFVSLVVLETGTTERQHLLKMSADRIPIFDQKDLLEILIKWVCYKVGHLKPRNSDFQWFLVC